MNTDNAVVRDVLDDPDFSQYQNEMGRTYGVHPSFFPATAPDEDQALAGVAGGFKRRAPTQPSQEQLTPAEQRLRLAVDYGLRPEFVAIEPFEDEAAALATEQARAALDDRRLARRAEIAEKYQVSPDLVPLAWLDE